MTLWRDDAQGVWADPALWTLPATNIDFTEGFPTATLLSSKPLSLCAWGLRVTQLDMGEPILERKCIYVWGNHILYCVPMSSIWEEKSCFSLSANPSCIAQLRDYGMWYWVPGNGQLSLSEMIEKGHFPEGWRQAEL